MRILVISSSPRHDGNSHLLAQAAIDGAIEQGHEVEHVFADEFVRELMASCRTCRLADGACGLTDTYEDLLLNRMLPADGIIYAMPLYFYGMPGRLKTIFDRLFCYTGASAPEQDRVVECIMHKRVGVLISCEENYLGATAGVTAQFQELTRYLNQDLVDVVIGRGNSRGEIQQDPTNPLSRAHHLGEHLFDTRVTDYRLDTARPNRVWEG